MAEGHLSPSTCFCWWNAHQNEKKLLSIVEWSGLNGGWVDESARGELEECMRRKIVAFGGWRSAQTGAPNSQYRGTERIDTSSELYNERVEKEFHFQRSSWVTDAEFIFLNKRQRQQMSRHWQLSDVLEAVKELQGPLSKAREKRGGRNNA
ncbi:hypothetical protein R1flu_018564 [Riccia fluitans]|uniref:Uncharacterized protein n=1 Tax=Riccia fluitans TaxID=41844 RepID=A0ABD1ZIG9_9MARC